jgi:hypothetical protein
MKIFKQFLSVFLLFSLFIFSLLFYYDLILEHTISSEHLCHCPFLGIIGGFVFSSFYILILSLFIICLILLFYETNLKTALFFNPLQNKAPPALS